MTPKAHVIFIHGLANKPAPADLERIWLEALEAAVSGDAGLDLRERGCECSFVYWADLFYDKPIAAADYESVKGTPGELEASVRSDLTAGKDEWTKQLRSRYPESEAEDREPPLTEKAQGFERIPIPWVMKQQVLRAFAREAHDYLFDVNGVRQTIRNRVMKILNGIASPTRRILVSHSQGTFIAYDVLTGVEACTPVHGLMTIGSPLGVDEIQDKLTWTRENGFPSKLSGRWYNVYDPFDVVSRPDPRLANDFRKGGAEVVIDIEEENWGKWRHSATKYLKGPRLRAALRALCDGA